MTSHHFVLKGVHTLWLGLLLSMFMAAGLTGCDMVDGEALYGTGTLTAETMTDGLIGQDSSFLVTVHGGPSWSISPNGRVVIPDLSPGEYVIELTGVHPDCVVDRDNPRTVSVTDDDTTATRFQLTCKEPSGPVVELPAVSIPSEADWSSPRPIVTPGDSGAWDVRLNGKSSLIKKDGTYYLYYLGADGDRPSDGGPAHRAVGLATSTDGETWTKHPDNPVISWEDMQNHGDDEEGAWGVAAYVDKEEILLYISDLIGSGGSVNGDIRLYVSDDGTSFDDRGIVIDHRNHAFPGDDELKPVGVYEDTGGTWHMYYIGKGGGINWALCHAVGTARDQWTSGRVVSGRGTDDREFRHGGDVVVLEEDERGVTVGLTNALTTGIDYYTFTSADFAEPTLARHYTFDTQQSAHYLDRENGRWMLITGGPSDDIAALSIRTAPLALEE